MYQCTIFWTNLKVQQHRLQLFGLEMQQKIIELFGLDCWKNGKLCTFIYLLHQYLSCVQVHAACSPIFVKPSQLLQWHICSKSEACRNIKHQASWMSGQPYHEVSPTPGKIHRKSFMINPTLRLLNLQKWSVASLTGNPEQHVWSNTATSLASPVIRQEHHWSWSIILGPKKPIKHSRK